MDLYGSVYLATLQVDRLMTTVEDLSLVQDQASMVLNGHFFGKESNIVTSTKIIQNEGFLIFASCAMCLAKKCGFLGFSLLIFVEKLLFLQMVISSPWDPGSCQMKNDLAKLRPNGKLDQNFQLEASTHRTHQLFFFPLRMEI